MNDEATSKARGVFSGATDTACTLLLIPGMGNNERLWADQVIHFRDRCRLAVPNYSGCESIRDMSDTVLSQSPDGPLCIAGFSLGSYIALDIVSRYPERVKRLALISASPFADDEATRTQRRRLVDKARRDYASLLRDMAGFVVAASGPHAQHARNTLVQMGIELGVLEFARQQLAAMERPDKSERLGDIRCPTRVLCGGKDPITPVSGNRFIADRIPDAKLNILENAGHLLPLEDPRAVNQFLHDWLQLDPN